MFMKLWKMVSSSWCLPPETPLLRLTQQSVYNVSVKIFLSGDVTFTGF